MARRVAPAQARHTTPVARSHQPPLPTSAAHRVEKKARGSRVGSARNELEPAWAHVFFSRADPYAQLAQKMSQLEPLGGPFGSWA